jgi:hypothetical protein
VRRLTPAERGVWIDCLALMATASPIGYLCDDRGRPLTHEEIARVTGTTPVEVAELLAAIQRKGVASVDRTGRTYNRRMVRDASLSAKRRAIGKDGGAATRLKWQELSALQRQNARQLPQMPVAPPYPLSKLTSSLPSTAREEGSQESGPPRKQESEPRRQVSAELEAVMQRKLTRSPYGA